MKQSVQNLLALADVQINGNKPWDIQIRNPKLYARVLSNGSLGLGEAYMDGWWDCKRLDQFFTKVLKADLEQKFKGVRPVLWSFLKAKVLNLQNKSRVYEVGKKHYDVGNELYKKCLIN